TRADILYPAVGVDERAGQPFGRRPVQAREIAQRGRGPDQKGAEPPRIQIGGQGRDSGAPFVGGDGGGGGRKKGHGSESILYLISSRVLFSWHGPFRKGEPASGRKHRDCNRSADAAGA